MTENIVLSEMTWTEVEQALKERPVALLPIGATEAHGPHLPVNADALVVEEWARRAALKLKQKGVASVILPTLPFGAHSLASDFPGTLTLSPQTTTAVVREVCVAAAKRFRAVAVMTLHFEAAQLDPVRAGVDEAKKEGVSVCFADLSKKRWADKLGKAFTTGEHAGTCETSLVMASAPGKVREKERISLPPVEGAGEAIRKGAKSFAEAGAEDAYCGDPTASSAEEGDALLATLADILTVSVLEQLGSKA
jgi:creatinine amidohydrolase